jgi:hypothetical protein
MGASLRIPAHEEVWTCAVRYVHGVRDANAVAESRGRDGFASPSHPSPQGQQAHRHFVRAVTEHAAHDRLLTVRFADLLENAPRLIDLVMTGRRETSSPVVKPSSSSA